MAFAASRGIPACIYAHGNKTSQQSCSHRTAICNHRLQNTLYLRTQEQPHSAEHPVGTNQHVQGTPAATASAAATTLPEKHSISRSGFRPNTSPHVVPCNSLCSHYNAFCILLQHHMAYPYASTHMARKHHNNHAAITLRSVITGSKPLLYLRTHEQPHSAEHPVETNQHVQRDPSRNRLSGCSHLTLKTQVFRARASAPTQAPM